MKKCPYCAEDIQDEAIVCRYCGRNLDEENRENFSEKRALLAMKLIELEKAQAGWERYLQIQTLKAQNANNAKTWGIIGTLISLLLIPVVIGIITVFICYASYTTHNSRRYFAEKNIVKSREEIEKIRGLIAEVRVALETNLYKDDLFRKLDESLVLPPQEPVEQVNGQPASQPTPVPVTMPSNQRGRIASKTSHQNPIQSLNINKYKILEVGFIFVIAVLSLSIICVLTLQ